MKRNKTELWMRKIICTYRFVVELDLEIATGIPFIKLSINELQKIFKESQFPYGKLYQKIPKSKLKLSLGQR